MSLEVKPFGSGVAATLRSPLTYVALGTTLVLIAYVVPLATIVATSRDLDPGPTARAWILSSMSVGLAAALLASGVVGDSLGRRRTYALGLVALALGSVVCAVAPDALVLVIGRVVQGAGGAAVLSCGLATVAHITPPGPARANATAIWGASVGLGITLGAILTAVLDLGSGWRPSYAATAVLAALLVVPSLRLLPESGASVGAAAGTSAGASAGPGARGRRIDIGGLVLLVVAMTAVVSALTQARDGIDAATVALAVVTLLALVGFVVVERRVGDPLLDPELLASPRFRAATLGSFVLGVGMIGMTSFAPTMAQLTMGAGLWGAAAPVLAWSVTSVITALSLRFSPIALDGSRPLGILLLLVAASQMLAIGVDETSSLFRLTWPMAVAGVFTGALNGLLGREAVASVPPVGAAMGSGANNTARYLGAACGITLFVVIATHSGAGLGDGWGIAATTMSVLTTLGAVGVLVLGRAPVVPAPARS